LHALSNCLRGRYRPCKSVLHFLKTVQAVRDELLEDIIMPEITLQDPQQQKFFNINSSEVSTQVGCNSKFSLMMFIALYSVTTEHKTTSV
jgi:hypothetical protein